VTFSVSFEAFMSRPVTRLGVSGRSHISTSTDALTHRARAVLLCAAASTVTLLAAVRPVAAQEASRDSIMVRPVLLMRAVPDGFDRRAPAAAARVERTQWQHGALTVGHGGGRFRWAGPDNTFVESRNAVEFLLGLGADSQLRLRAERGLDEVQAAILGELGRQHWELVSCQHIANEYGERMTQCYLKRPVASTP